MVKMVNFRFRVFYHNVKKIFFRASLAAQG